MYCFTNAPSRNMAGDNRDEYDDDDVPFTKANYFLKMIAFR